MSPELRMVQDPVFPKVQKNIMQDVRFDDLAMTQVISNTAQNSTTFRTIALGM